MPTGSTGLLQPALLITPRRTGEDTASSHQRAPHTGPLQLAVAAWTADQAPAWLLPTALDTTCRYQHRREKKEGD